MKTAILVNEKNVLRNSRHELVELTKKFYPKYQNEVASWTPGWGHEGKELAIVGKVVFEKKEYYMLQAKNHQGMIWFVPEDGIVISGKRPFATYEEIVGIAFELNKAYTAIETQLVSLRELIKKADPEESGVPQLIQAVAELESIIVNDNTLFDAIGHVLQANMKEVK